MKNQEDDFLQNRSALAILNDKAIFGNDKYDILHSVDQFGDILNISHIILLL